MDFLLVHRSKNQREHRRKNGVHRANFLHFIEIEVKGKCFMKIDFVETTLEK